MKRAGATASTDVTADAEKPSDEHVLGTGEVGQE
jgi:hypothetical protein